MTLDFRAYAQSLDLARYPRTPHLEGSRLQDGDVVEFRTGLTSKK